MVCCSTSHVLGDDVDGNHGKSTPCWLDTRPFVGGVRLDDCISTAAHVTLVRSVDLCSRRDAPECDTMCAFAVAGGVVMVEVHGSCDERFRPLRDLFQADLDSGVDEGGSFAVNCGRRVRRRSLGRIPGPGAHRAVGARHGREGVLHVEGGRRHRHADVVGPGIARPGRADRDVLARVRTERQGHDHGATRSRAQLGPAGLRLCPNTRRPARLGSHDRHRGTGGGVVRAGNAHLLPPDDVRLHPG